MPDRKLKGLNPHSVFGRKVQELPTVTGEAIQSSFGELSPEVVCMIRKHFAEGFSIAQIIRMYDLTKHVVCDIVRWKTYKASGGTYKYARKRPLRGEYLDKTRSLSSKQKA